MTSGTAESSNSLSIAVVVEPTSSRPLIQPSSVVVTDDTNKHKQVSHNTIVLTGNCNLVMLHNTMLCHIYDFFAMPGGPCNFLQAQNFFSLETSM